MNTCHKRLAFPGSGYPLYILTAFFLLHILSAQGQYWIVGDTAGLQEFSIEKTFPPEAAVTFDLDCDGQHDLVIRSTDGNTISSPWDRLNLSLAPNVEVLNSGEGKVTTFEPGDTLLYLNSLWTPNLSFIYGTGKLGPYGTYEINEKYIAFRKNAPDTSYCFIKFSSLALEFTIHEILSPCQNNPFDILTSVSPITSWPLSVFPNPFSARFTIQTDNTIEALVLYDAMGRPVHQLNGRTFDLPQLPSGWYYLKIWDDQNRIQVVPLLKQ